MKRKLLIMCLFIFGFSIGFLTYAEQSGSSPTSNVTSYIKTAYDWLDSKGTNYGSSSAPDWTNDWGTYWNRMMYSATWEPDGTATEEDVLSGKTFYSGNNNRTIRTGTATATAGLDYSQQSLIEYDDYEDPDYQGEESSWTSPATNVWLDTRTGLYWSNSRGSYTNIFPNQDHSTCDFFNEGTYPTRGEYGTSGTDPDCGNAINACAVLTLTSGGTSNTDWYLPSQKELDQAYMDGMYNQAGSTFTTTSTFWSSTEYSDNSTYAWYITLYDGYAVYGSKTVSDAVRCVRRD